jgi:hypothetical protein
MSVYEDPLILSSIRERIGEGLRERYQVPQELPPELLALAGRFGKWRTLIGILDAIEGNYLKRYSSIPPDWIDHSPAPAPATTSSTSPPCRVH